MADYKSEFNLALSASKSALTLLGKLDASQNTATFDESNPREMKALSDIVLEKTIINFLRPSGIDILTEETGLLKLSEHENDGLRWIVDPLDGTVNFVRRIGPCAISIALWSGDKPLLGVLAEYPSGKLAWGGLGQGAYYHGERLKVSNISELSKSVLCTGFPSRFDFNELEWVTKRFSEFAKIRMMGAASISLLQIAKGSAEYYLEREIMHWDVAAGLAILQEAGGSFSIEPTHSPNSFNVTASNGLVSPSQLLFSQKEEN